MAVGRASRIDGLPPLQFMQVEAKGKRNHPKPVYPAKFDDIAGMKVPKGGSSCETCEYLKDAHKKLCGEPNFIKWNFGSNVIPTDNLDEYCSIWYEPWYEPGEE